MAILQRIGDGRNDIEWNWIRNDTANDTSEINDFGKYLSRNGTGRNNIFWLNITNGGDYNLLVRTSSASRNSLIYKNIHFNSAEEFFSTLFFNTINAHHVNSFPTVSSIVDADYYMNGYPKRGKFAKYNGYWKFDETESVSGVVERWVENLVFMIEGAGSSSSYYSVSSTLLTVEGHSIAKRIGNDGYINYTLTDWYWNTRYSVDMCSCKFTATNSSSGTSLNNIAPNYGNMYYN